jgi:hypothetical protein
VILRARAALLVAAAAAAIRLLPLRTARRLAARLAGAPSAPPAPGERDRIGRAVAGAARRIPGATCLARAVAAEALLRARGLPAALHVAWDARGGRLDAHAFAASGGVPVGDGGAGGRAALVALPSPRSHPAPS